MDTEKLVAYLINGMLINILTRGLARHSVAWIVTDNMTSAGFRLHYDQIPVANEAPAGGKPAPRGATDGRAVLEDKKSEVVDDEK